MYQIRYGLGGGFGGCGEWEKSYSNSLEDAELEAYENAVLLYDSYGGMHGLDSIEDIMEENPEYDEEDAKEQHRYYMESWLEYEARET